MKHTEQTSGLRNTCHPHFVHTMTSSTSCARPGDGMDRPLFYIRFLHRLQSQKLENKYSRVLNKIKTILKKWTLYNLSLRGRLTLAGTMLVSQLTYISTVLTPNTERLIKIQQHVNDFFKGLTTNNKNWINANTLYVYSSTLG